MRETAFEEMASRCETRMRLLARRMRRQFHVVRRWNDTDDILQESSMRLHRALRNVVPESELHLYRLACLQVRRVLLDLSREYAGRRSFAANHDTGHGDRLDRTIPDPREGGERDVVCLENWERFHLAAEALPRKLRDVFDLLWYAEFDQETAAGMLGITKRTLQRRWRMTRRLLVRELADDIPL